MARIEAAAVCWTGLMGAFCGLYGEPGLASLTEEAAGHGSHSAHGPCGELAAPEGLQSRGGRDRHIPQ